MTINFAYHLRRLCIPGPINSKTSLDSLTRVRKLPETELPERLDPRCFALKEVATQGMGRTVVDSTRVFTQRRAMSYTWGDKRSTNVLCSLVLFSLCSACVQPHLTICSSALFL